jgi:hypothetical protein
VGQSASVPHFPQLVPVEGRGHVHVPEHEARLFLELLDGLGEQATREAYELRRALIQLVGDCRCRQERGTCPEDGRCYAAARLATLEAEACALAACSARSLRERIAGDSRRLGLARTASAGVRRVVQGLEYMISALDQLAAAVRLGDEDVRADARRLVIRARQLLPAAPSA